MGFSAATASPGSAQGEQREAQRGRGVPATNACGGMALNASDVAEPGHHPVDAVATTATKSHRHGPGTGRSVSKILATSQRSWPLCGQLATVVRLTRRVELVLLRLAAMLRPHDRRQWVGEHGWCGGTQYLPEWCHNSEPVIGQARSDHEPQRRCRGHDRSPTGEVGAATQRGRLSCVPRSRYGTPRHGGGLVLAR